jgi:phage baseplate assembly protein W|tara:strand:+ start:211 stop:636 length:426 start_codon:yes stop_codon:yes gene_type:complete
MASRDYTKPNSKTTSIKNEYSDIDIMFTAHPISGDITTKKDSDAVKRAVRNIILTNDYERPFKPNFGANLRAQLFELQGIGSKKRIASDISDALSALEPRIRNVRVTFGEEKANSIDVRISYTIINGLGQSAVDFTVNRVR